MTELKRFALGLAVGLMTLVVGTGCALSPQQIQVQPSVSLIHQDLGRGMTIAVSSIDNRNTPVIGSRGGMYADTSTIEVTNLEPALLSAVTSGLTQLGFTTTTADNSSAELPDFHVSVNSIKYTMPPQAMPADVGVSVELELLVSEAHRTYKGRYTARATRRFVTPPDLSDNRELINNTIEKALLQMFIDDKMRDFISGRQ